MALNDMLDISHDNNLFPLVNTDSFGNLIESIDVLIESVPTDKRQELLKYTDFAKLLYSGINVYNGVSLDLDKKDKGMKLDTDKYSRDVINLISRIGMTNNELIKKNMSQDNLSKINKVLSLKLMTDSIAIFGTMSGIVAIPYLFYETIGNPCLSCLSGIGGIYLMSAVLSLIESLETKVVSKYVKNNLHSLSNQSHELMLNLISTMEQYKDSISLISYPRYELQCDFATLLNRVGYNHTPNSLLSCLNNELNNLKGYPFFSKLNLIYNSMTGNTLNFNLVLQKDASVITPEILGFIGILSGRATYKNNNFGVYDSGLYNIMLRHINYPYTKSIGIININSRDYIGYAGYNLEMIKSGLYGTAQGVLELLPERTDFIFQTIETHKQKIQKTI